MVSALSISDHLRADPLCGRPGLVVSLGAVLLPFLLAFSPCAHAAVDPSRATETQSYAELTSAELSSQEAARSASPASAKFSSGVAFDRTNGASTAAPAAGGDPSGQRADSGGANAPARPRGEVPMPTTQGGRRGPPAWLLYGGAAVLGGLGAWAAGAGLSGIGLAAGLGALSAYLYHARGDYGAAFGVAAGSLLGLALFPAAPGLGPLVGAAVGGIVGHFLGLLFS